MIQVQLIVQAKLQLIIKLLWIALKLILILLIYYDSCF